MPGDNWQSVSREEAISETKTAKKRGKNCFDASLIATAIAKKIIGVKTVDHPTDGQVLAYAKECFQCFEQLKGYT